MAKKPMVTRTFKKTVVSFKVVNPATMEMSTSAPILLSKKFDSEDKIIDWANRNKKVDGRAFAVEAIEVIEELRGMSEEEFFNNSVILDPETRKPVTTETK